MLTRILGKNKILWIIVHKHRYNGNYALDIYESSFTKTNCKMDFKISIKLLKVTGHHKHLSKDAESLKMTEINGQNIQNILYSNVPVQLQKIVP